MLDISDFQFHLLEVNFGLAVMVSWNITTLFCLRYMSNVSSWRLNLKIWFLLILQVYSCFIFILFRLIWSNSWISYVNEKVATFVYLRWARFVLHRGRSCGKICFRWLWSAIVSCFSIWINLDFIKDRLWISYSLRNVSIFLCLILGVEF